MAMPLGHGSQEQRLRPLERREKRLAGGVAALAVIAAVVLLIVTLTQPARRSGHGCIALSLTYSTGGTQTYQCGAAARAMCAAAGSAALNRAARPIVARECRHAGLSVG